MTPRDVLEVTVGLLVGGVSFVVVGGFLFVAVVSVEELAGKMRRRLFGDRSLQLGQYRAEQALHSIRREAVHDMLEAACTQRGAYDEVIEGTAVEIRP